MTQDRPVRILAFAGSLRRKSFNRGLIRAALEVKPDGVDMDEFDILPIPLYNRDVEDEGMPAPVAEFRKKIAAADALLIAAPEYNWSIPGVLKNAIDWASSGSDSPLIGKPYGLMGASPMWTGTVQSQQHLRQALLANSMHALVRPVLHVSSARGKFDDDGNLTDAPTKEKIRVLVEALVAWTKRLRNEG